MRAPPYPRNIKALRLARRAARERARRPTIREWGSNKWALAGRPHSCGGTKRGREGCFRARGCIQPRTMKWSQRHFRREAKVPPRLRRSRRRPRGQAGVLSNHRMRMRSLFCRGVATRRGGTRSKPIVEKNWGPTGRWRRRRRPMQSKALPRIERPGGSRGCDGSSKGAGKKGLAFESPANGGWRLQEGAAKPGMVWWGETRRKGALRAQSDGRIESKYQGAEGGAEPAPESKGRMERGNRISVVRGAGKGRGREFSQYQSQLRMKGAGGRCGAPPRGRPMGKWAGRERMEGSLGVCVVQWLGRGARALWRGSCQAHLGAPGGPCSRQLSSADAAGPAGLPAAQSWG